MSIGSHGTPSSSQGSETLVHEAGHPVQSELARPSGVEQRTAVALAWLQMKGRAGEPAALVMIFVRAPVAGTVKTRLAADVGDAAALAVYRELTERAVYAARELGPRATTRVLFTPRHARISVVQWLGTGMDYRAQGRGSLGVRLQRAFADGFSEGFRRLVVIGSDLPAISPALLRDAIGALEENEAVIGPAADGGYYLLGLRRPVPALFRDVPWSTSEVCAATLERLRAGGVSPRILSTMQDVDTAADLPADLLHFVTR